MYAQDDVLGQVANSWKEVCGRKDSGHDSV